MPSSSRYLTAEEKSLLTLLLENHAEGEKFLAQLGRLEAEDMPEIGPGSLYFPHPRKLRAHRTIGNCLAQIEYRDEDGSPVLASLDTDTDGDLLELNVFKAD